MKVVEKETGAVQFGEALRAAGVTTIFAVSGNQILSLFEGAAEAGIRIVHFRHESAAAYAAAGWADITGTTGVALVAGGPGFYAALTGVGVASSMEVPILVVSGGTPITNDKMGAFQFVELTKIGEAICKLSVQAQGGAEVGNMIASAIAAAHAPIPGPVHVTIPVDVCLGETNGDPKKGSFPIPSAPMEVDGAARATLDAIAEGLAAAKKPVVIARPSATRGSAGESLRAIAKALGVQPVVMECPRGSEDMRHAPVTSRYAESDFVLLVGPADFTVHFLTQARVATSGRVAVIDVEGDPDPQRKVDFHVRLAPEPALKAIAAKIGSGTRPGWVPVPDKPVVPDGGAAIHPLAVGLALRDAVKPDDLIVLDGGEFCQWVRLAFADLPNKIIWNSRLGAIGGSIALAIGAAATGKYKRILTVLGDGTLGYHAAEIETAVREKFPLVIVVGNDERWAAEWHTQTEKYGRAVSTMLTNARYHKVAEGYGGRGFDITDVAELRTRLDEALDNPVPTLFNVHIESVKSPAVSP